MIVKATLVDVKFSSFPTESFIPTGEAEVELATFPPRAGCHALCYQRYPF